MDGTQHGGTTVCMSAGVSRRAAMASFLSAALPFAVAPLPAHAAADAKQVEAALRKICAVPPEKVPSFVPPPLEELCVGVVDDGGRLAKAAIAVLLPPALLSACPYSLCTGRSGDGLAQLERLPAWGSQRVHGNRESRQWGPYPCR